jgi:hypothetical protein
MRKRKWIVLAGMAATSALLFLASEKSVLRAAPWAQAQAEKQAPQDKSAPQLSTTEIIIGKLAPYSHKSELFTVSFPDNWTIKDNSSPDEVILVVSDPNVNGVVVLHCYSAADLTPADLSASLKSFIHDHMGTMDEFTMNDPTPLKNGNFHVVFRFTQTVKDQDIRMYGEAFIQQHNGYVGLSIFFLPQEQYSMKSKAIYEITDSFHVIGKPKPAGSF